MNASIPAAGDGTLNPIDATPLPVLLERVRAHDEIASRELIARLYPLVAQIVHANLPRRDEPEDLTQEVFMKMFSRLEQYRGDVPFERWVSRITLNTCLDRLRRQKVRPELRWADFSEEEQAIFAEVPDNREPTDADAGTARSLVEKLFAGLSPDDAFLLRRIELEQQSLAEVCAETGWNSGATRVRLFRARRRLQKLMRELENSES